MLGTILACACIGIALALACIGSLSHALHRRRLEFKGVEKLVVRTVDSASWHTSEKGLGVYQYYFGGSSLINYDYRI